MQVRIYQPGKSAMQSGHANSKRWLLQFEPESPREVEPLMGWTSSRDMRSQLYLWFDSKDDAVAYAKRHNLMYQVEEARERPVRQRAYADNFRAGRVHRWTH